MKESNPTKLALTFLAKRNPLDEYISQSEYVGLLMSFQDNKGDEALQALAGFYVWAIDNLAADKKSNAIATTFAHDLYKSDDEWMLPRSSNYLEFWVKEISKWQ